MRVSVYIHHKPLKGLEIVINLTLFYKIRISHMRVQATNGRLDVLVTDLECRRVRMQGTH